MKCVAFFFGLLVLAAVCSSQDIKPNYQNRSTPCPGTPGTPGAGTPTTPGPGSSNVTNLTPVCDSKGASCTGLETGTLLSYKGDCTKFVDCVEGCGIDMNCPSGLHFNNKLEVCDWPEDAGCDPSITRPPGGGTPSTPGAGTPGTPGAGTPTTPGPGSSNDTNLTPVCDSKGASCTGLETGTLLSYKGDCTKFVDCVGGCGIDMNCPSGLHFNNKLKVCDWPEDAGCDPSITRPPGGGTPSTPGAGTPSTPGAGTPSTPGAGTPSTPGAGTPSTPGAGTPSTPGAGTPSTPSAGTPSTPGAGTPSTPGAGTPSTPGSGSPNVTSSTPVCDSKGASCTGLETGTLLSYKDDCTKFVDCVGGCGVDMNCPSGLHFNNKLNVCDWPEDAGCDPSIARPPSAETPATPGPGSSNVTNSTPVCDSKGASCTDKETGTLLSYKGDCTKFVDCVGGCGVDMNCPSGLHFNNKLSVCDWPEDAGCDPSVTKVPGGSSTPSPISTTRILPTPEFCGPHGKRCLQTISEM